MSCTNPNHGFFLRAGVPCDCAITSRLVNGRLVDCTVREEREAHSTMLISAVAIRNRMRRHG